jgi:hypothetical protein
MPGPKNKLTRVISPSDPDTPAGARFACEAAAAKEDTMAAHSHSRITPRRPIPLGFTPELFPEGTHICYLYSDEDERKRFMADYVHSGIDNNESVIYVPDSGADTLESAVAEMGIAAPGAPDDQLTLATAMDIYFPSGEFIPETVLEQLRELYANVPRGYHGARCAGEMTWALRDVPGTERLIEYETRINDVLKEFPLTTLCQYDTRKFSGATIFELLNVHPIMIVHGQIMRNPFYAPRGEPPEANNKKPK